MCMRCTPCPPKNIDNKHLEDGALIINTRLNDNALIINTHLNADAFVVNKHWNGDASETSSTTLHFVRWFGLRVGCRV